MINRRSAPALHRACLHLIQQPERKTGWDFAPVTLENGHDSGFAGRIGDRDVVEVSDTALGPLLRPETRDAIRRAGSRRDAMTLLLTSPEFQRR